MLHRDEVFGFRRGIERKGMKGARERQVAEQKTLSYSRDASTTTTASTLSFSMVTAPCVTVVRPEINFSFWAANSCNDLYYYRFDTVLKQPGRRVT